MSAPWYPGHMAASKRLIYEKLPSVDFVIEMLDARIPLSSRNPDIGKICARKPHLILLSKCDLADERRTASLKAVLASDGAAVIAVDSRTKRGYGKIAPAIRELTERRRQRSAERGMVGRKLRGMVLGITNVGKSTFINRFAGENKAKAENRPGVTTRTQWVSAPGGIELLDTPGLLRHATAPEVVEKLAFTGAIKDEALDMTDTAARLAELLKQLYPRLLEARCGVGFEDGESAAALLERMALKRGFLRRGGEPDTERFASCLICEFRSGKIGRITLD